MSDGGVECTLGQLTANTEQILAEQARLRLKIEELSICKHAYELSLPSIDHRLNQLQSDVDLLKKGRWQFDGATTVAAWVGGVVLWGIIGVGVWLINWSVGPNGPFHR